MTRQLGKPVATQQQQGLKVENCNNNNSSKLDTRPDADEASCRSLDKAARGCLGLDCVGASTQAILRHRIKLSADCFEESKRPSQSEKPSMEAELKCALKMRDHRANEPKGISNGGRNGTGSSQAKLSSLDVNGFAWIRESILGSLRLTRPLCRSLALALALPLSLSLSLSLFSPMAHYLTGGRLNIWLSGRLSQTICAHWPHWTRWDAICAQSVLVIGRLRCCELISGLAKPQLEPKA